MAMTNDGIAKRIEQLAVAQAVYKLAASMVSTKEPGNLRADVECHFREAFESTGAKSFDVRIGGERVGTYSIKTTKGKKVLKLRTYDHDAYKEWCKESHFIKTVIDEEAVETYFTETGNIPDGCEVVEVETPDGAYNGGSLRIDPEKVNHALGGADVLPMLMGGA